MRGLALVLLVLPLAACGGTESGGSGTTPSTSLEISVKDAPNGVAKTATIQCPGDSVCDQLDALDPKVFDPVPGNIACTQIYGGPETAHVTGTFKGRSIDADFKRTDGCETARWAKVQFLFARAG